MNINLLNLNLSEEEKALLPKIEKYIIETGYYNEPQMNKDFDTGVSSADLFFGDYDGQDLTETDVPEVELAKKLNDAWDELVIAVENGEVEQPVANQVIAASPYLQEKMVEAQEVEAAMQRIKSGKHTNADLNLMVKAGLARQVGDPADQFSGAGIEFIEPRAGNPYTDNYEEAFVTRG